MAAQVPSRLYRSRSQKMIAGVCGGLGEYFDVDPILIRLLFVITAFISGVGILAYIVLWIVLPFEGDQTPRMDALRRDFDDISGRVREYVDPPKAGRSDGAGVAGGAEAGSGAGFGGAEHGPFAAGPTGSTSFGGTPPAGVAGGAGPVGADAARVPGATGSAGGPEAGPYAATSATGSDSGAIPRAGTISYERGAMRSDLTATGRLSDPVDPLTIDADPPSGGTPDANTVRTDPRAEAHTTPLPPFGPPAPGSTPPFGQPGPASGQATGPAAGPAPDPAWGASVPPYGTPTGGPSDAPHGGPWGSPGAGPSGGPWGGPAGGPQSGPFGRPVGGPFAGAPFTFAGAPTDRRRRRQHWAGAILIIIGFLILGSNLGLLRWARPEYVIPLILIVAGAWLLFGRGRRG